MKITILILLLLISTVSHAQREIAGKYEHYLNDDGFYDRITIDLMEDSTFTYLEVNEQICYQTTKESFGKWKISSDTLILLADSSLLPQITYLENKPKNDTLTIKAFDQNGKAYRGWFSFFGANQPYVYLNSFSSKVQIPLNKGIDSFKFGNLSIKVKPEYEEIAIKNVSDKVIYDFSNLKFFIKRNSLQTIQNIAGPTGRQVKGKFKRIK